MLNFVICDDNLNILNKLKEMLEILFIKNDIDAKVGFYTDEPKKVLEYEKENIVDHSHSSSRGIVSELNFKLSS